MTFPWVAVAPGRVNLIGEHTDYNGLPVLPMALDRDVRIEFEVLDAPVVELSSPLKGLESFSFSLEGPIERATQGDWSNYVRAAANGLVEDGTLLQRGIRGVVSGSVPLAAGLSSSSALVVATALALLHANRERVEAIEPLALARLLARSERFVGLEGGGMDQTVCLFGRSGHAVRIDFRPLQVSHVPVPRGWRWIVAHSLERAEKSGAAMDAYNARTRECADALRVVARELDLGPEEGYAEMLATTPVGRLLEVAKRSLQPVPLRRFRHVVSEGDRVARAQRAMESNNLAGFGRLMTESHISLKEDFEVSTEALDRIVELALEAEAAGARLTGAGFGGCAVALCDDRSAARVQEALARDFYGKKNSRDLEDLLFEARPSDGARVTETALAPRADREA
ncbi:MAG: galactokinase [Longimicrobiales bacterium]